MARSAREIAELLAAQRFDDVRNDFDENLSAKLSTRMLRRGWRTMRLRKGKYLGVAGEPSEHDRDGFRVIDLPLQFRRANAKLRVAYTSDDRIAGLIILNPEVL
jgi:hypothetical protein